MTYPLKYWLIRLPIYFLVGFVAVKLVYTPTMRLSNGVKIPLHIVAFKDCKAFSAFVESQAMPGYIPDPSCPWGAEGQRMGYFTLGTIQLAVPREYIWFGRNVPNGIVDGVSLAFNWPDMKPGDTNKKDQSKQIVGVIGYLKDRRKCSEHQPNGPFYDCMAVPFRTQMAYLNTTITDEAFDEHLNMHSFILNQYNGEHKLTKQYKMFYRGDREYPSEWLICVVAHYDYNDNKLFLNPRCEAYIINDHLNFSYGFRMSLLSDYPLFHQEINKKITSFVLKQ